MLEGFEANVLGLDPSVPTIGAYHLSHVLSPTGEDGFDMECAMCGRHDDPFTCGELADPCPNAEGKKQ